MSKRTARKRARKRELDQAGRRKRLVNFLSYVETRREVNALNVYPDEPRETVEREWARQACRVGVPDVHVAPVPQWGQETEESLVPPWFAFIAYAVGCWGESIADDELRLLCDNHRALMAAVRLGGARAFRALWDALVEERDGHS